MVVDIVTRSWRPRSFANQTGPRRSAAPCRADLSGAGHRRPGTGSMTCAVSALDQPALMPWDGDSPPAPPPGPLREAMVVFRDGTWRLCRVTGWWQEPPPGRHWWYLLRWGVQGIVHEGWFRHDPAVVTPFLIPGRSAVSGGVPVPSPGVPVPVARAVPAAQ